MIQSKMREKKECQIWGGKRVGDRKHEKQCFILKEDENVKVEGKENWVHDPRLRSVSRWRDPLCKLHSNAYRRKDPRRGGIGRVHRS